MQPLLGVFTIPIGEIMFIQLKQRKDEIEGLDNILEEIDKILIDEGVVSYNI